MEDMEISGHKKCSNSLRGRNHMNYTLRIAGQDIPIEANRVDDETISAAVNDKNVTVRYRNVSANQLYLEVNGEAVNAFISDDGTGKIVHVDGIAYLVQDAEELARSAGRKKAARTCLRRLHLQCRRLS